MARHARLLRSLHLFPSVLVAAVTVALVPVADPDAPSARYAQLGLGMLLFQFAIGLLNDVVDVEDDRRAGRGKPLPTYPHPRRALPVVVLLAAGGLAVTAALPPLAWALGALGLACGVAYDLRLKRTEWAWVPYSLALPLVPLWVWTAVAGWRPALAWVLPTGVLLGLALHLANQAPDAAHDQGLAGRLGAERARSLAVAAFASACAVAALALITVGHAWAMATLVVCTAAALAALLARRSRALFGVLALATAVVAPSFLLALSR